MTVVDGAKEVRRPRALEIKHFDFSRLGPRSANVLFDELTEVVADSITPGCGVDESWAASDWNSRRSNIMQDGLVYAALSGGQMVAFVAYRLTRVLSRPTIHLIAACVVPEFQGCGVAFAINARIFYRALIAFRFAPFYIAAHVMNPVALDGWRRRTGNSANFFPPLTDPPPRAGLVSAAAACAEQWDPGLPFDPATGVVAGRHLSGARTHVECGCPEVDRLYRDHVSASSGDTVLMVVDANRRAVASQVVEVFRAAPRALALRLHPRFGGRA